MKPKGENALRHHIQTCVSNSKLQTTCNVVKNSQRKKFRPYSSDIGSIGSIGCHIIDSPTLLTETNTRQNTTLSKSLSHDTRHHKIFIRRVRSAEKNKTVQKSRSVQKGKKKSGDKLKKLEIVRESPNYLLQTLQKMQERRLLSRGDSGYKLKSPHLSSIAQKSENMHTPSSKSQSGSKRRDDKTSKKQYSTQLLTPNTRRKILSSFREYDVFQRLLNHEALTVSYRILPNRLLEIQICPRRKLQQMLVKLDKGNCECQNINQMYHDPSENKIITLLSSVRNIDLHASLNSFMKLHVEAVFGDSQIDKVLTIPLTWLHCISKATSEDDSRRKLSRIKTKAYLEHLPLRKDTLKLLSLLFGSDLKRAVHSKDMNSKDVRRHLSFECRFMLDGSDYEIRVNIRESHYCLEVEGRGEQILTSMLEFIQCLLAN